MSKRLPLIVALAAVIVVAGWFVAVWRPAGSHLASLRAAEITTSAQQAQYDVEISHLEAIKRALPGEYAELRNTLSELPLTLSADSVIDQINTIALKDHIAWTNESEAVSAATATTTPTTLPATTATTTASGSSSTTTPTTVAPTAAATGAVATSGAATLALTLTVAGSYTNMSHFITALQERPRLIILDTLAYAPSGPKVSVSLTATAFYDATALPAVAGH